MLFSSTYIGNSEVIALEENLRTVEEVAEYLRVSNTTVYTLVREGKLRGVKVGRAWRFLASDVDAYLKRTMEEQADNKE